MSKPKPQRSPAVQKAIVLAGGVGCLAKRLDLDPSSVSAWQKVPVRHIMSVAVLFEGRISLEEMQAEHFGQ